MDCTSSYSSSVYAKRLVIYLIQILTMFPSESLVIQAVEVSSSLKEASKLNFNQREGGGLHFLVDILPVPLTYFLTDASQYLWAWDLIDLLIEFQSSICSYVMIWFLIIHTLSIATRAKFKIFTFSSGNGGN